LSPILNVVVEMKEKRDPCMDGWESEKRAVALAVTVPVAGMHSVCSN